MKKAICSPDPFPSHITFNLLHTNQNPKLSLEILPTDLDDSKDLKKKKILKYLMTMGRGRRTWELGLRCVVLMRCDEM